MDHRERLDALFAEHGYTDYVWIDPTEIVVSEWVRIKCTFGCASYGRNGSCPPNVPSVPECRRFFDEYTTAALLHFEHAVDKPEDRHIWSREINQQLLRLERKVFLSGFQKAFLLFMDSCELCADCPGTRQACRNPQSARPSPESMAIDVFSTARRYGYPIEVLAEYAQKMNRYAFLLVE